MIIASMIVAQSGLESVPPSRDHDQVARRTVVRELHASTHALQQSLRREPPLSSVSLAACWKPQDERSLRSPLQRVA